MNQDYPRIEHIVMDGGSTDETVEILKKYEKRYRLRWFSEPDEGQTSAVNKGLKKCNGDIIGWLDSDDVYFDKNCISYIVNTFSIYPNTDVAYGNDVLIDPNNTIFRARRWPEWNYEQARRRFFVPSATTFFRRKVIDTYSMDGKLSFAMDLDFILKLGRNAKVKHVNRILAGTRLHNDRKSVAQKNLAADEGNVVMMKYGHRFGLSYYIYHFLVDFPATIVERAVGLSDLIKVKKMDRSLAFDGRTRDLWSSILSQLAPEFVLRALHLISSAGLK
jgi:glycosyltransferase involved in cell wall biosynthesis